MRQPTPQRTTRFGAAALVLLASLLAAREAAGDERVLEAVKRKDHAALRALLHAGSDAGAREPDGTTALHWAVRGDDAEAVAILLAGRVAVDARNRYGVGPLSLAAINGSPRVVDALLRAGADPRAALPEGETPLMTAARTGNAAVVRILLAYGADANARETWRGQTALMWAAAEGNVAAAQALIDAGADVRARSTAGFSPLMYAVRAGRLGTVEALLASGADVNETLPDGIAPLVLAVINAQYRVASLLVDHGANANGSESGWTALHQVAWTRRPNVGHNNPEPVHRDEYDSLDLVRKLLARSADPNARVTREPRTGLNSFKRIGATPFLVAAKSVDLELMRLLLEHGADPARTNADGTTALMVAAGVGMFAAGEDPGTHEESLQAVRLALDLGGDVLAVDANGDTALHGAAFRGANNVVEFLVEKGARLDAVNKKGWTPLRVAEGVFVNATLKSQPKTAALLREILASRAAAVSATR